MNARWNRRETVGEKRAVVVDVVVVVVVEHASIAQ